MCGIFCKRQRIKISRRLCFFLLRPIDGAPPNAEPYCGQIGQHGSETKRRALKALSARNLVGRREDCQYFYEQEKHHAGTHAKDEAKRNGNSKIIRLDQRAEAPDDTERDTHEECLEYADTVDEQPGRNLDGGMRPVDGAEKKRQAAVTHTENAHELDRQRAARS